LESKTLSFGAHPAVSLKDARERRDEARKLLANGADPGAVKKAQKAERLEHAANTFEAVAAKWFEKWKTEVTAKTAKNQRDRLVKHIMPFLGDCPIADIDAPKVLAALRPLEARGTGDTLDKAKMAVSLIMRLPAHRVGRLWKFKATEVDEWVRAGSAEEDKMNDSTGNQT
jgi:integrase